MTRSNNSATIEAFRLQHPHLRLPDFAYFDLSPTLIQLKKSGLLPVSLYYIIWQAAAVAQVRRIVSGGRFDIFWHLTFGVIRYPSFVRNLNIPVILGPLGGGERAPWSMRQDYGLGGHALDIVRDFFNQIARLDPLMRLLFQGATLILAKTNQSARLVSSKHINKTLVELEIGIAEVGKLRGNIGSRPPRLLFAGRFIHWKGVTLAVRAFAEFVRLGGRGRLTLLGRGPEAIRAKTLSARLGVAELIDWVEWVEQSQIQHVYDEHDLLLFPSLHDSSGNVVLEALARGLPVACFDLGGPGEIATAATGIVLNTKGLTAREAATKLGQRLYEFFKQPDISEAASAAAIERARQFLWPIRVEKFVNLIEEAIGQRARCRD